MLAPECPPAGQRKVCMLARLSGEAARFIQRCTEDRYGWRAGNFTAHDVRFGRLLAGAVGPHQSDAVPIHDGHDGGSRLAQLAEFQAQAFVLARATAETPKDALQRRMRAGIPAADDRTSFLLVGPKDRYVLSCAWLYLLSKQEHAVGDTGPSGR